MLGFDTDTQKIARLRAGQSYIGHIPAAWIADCVHSGRLTPTGDMSRLAEADVLLICVPTPLDDRREPDLQYVAATAREIATHLRPGQLIVLESTTYPGTTRTLLLPILQATGLDMGSDFFLAYSPEREDPGNPRYTADVIPKVVGGLEPASAALAEAFYRQFVEVVPVNSCDVAEACKVLENAYRAVNIALVNELKVVFDTLGIDIWQVIEAARTKPFGFQAFYPGPGLGGHCVPIDPFYLSWIARQHGVPARLVETAGEINAAMPDYVMLRLEQALASAGKELAGSRVCILGIAYKKDVDDPRESPAFALIERLLSAGATVSYHDPHVPRLPAMRHHQVPPLESVALDAAHLAAQDCVLIVTDHSSFDYDEIVRQSRLVVDTRGATRQVREGREKIFPA